MDQKPKPIDRIIVDAILAGTIRAGTRLGEQALATLFEVSRTSVREALIRLETRGILQVSPRRGWFVIEPSLEEAQEAFQARRAVELGILRTGATHCANVAEVLREHIGRERDAIRSGDIGTRSYLLGDFHVCMAEACGHRILADILRDLTARTVLISALYQSSHDAEASCDEHAAITDAIAANDQRRAADLMTAHIGNVEAGLTQRIDHDPLLDLRHALRLNAEIRGGSR